jgi:hypothetical protein
MHRVMPIPLRVTISTIGFRHIWLVVRAYCRHLIGRSTNPVARRDGGGGLGCGASRWGLRWGLRTSGLGRVDQGPRPPIGAGGASRTLIAPVRDMAGNLTSSACPARSKNNISKGAY